MVQEENMQLSSCLVTSRDRSRCKSDECEKEVNGTTIMGISLSDPKDHLLGFDAISTAYHSMKSSFAYRTYGKQRNILSESELGCGKRVLAATGKTNHLAFPYHASARTTRAAS